MRTRIRTRVRHAVARRSRRRDAPPPPAVPPGARRLAWTLAVVACVLGTAVPADAMWPFTRAKPGPRVVDEATWQQRFEAWKTRAVDRGAGADSATATSGAPVTVRTTAADAPPRPPSAAELAAQAMARARARQDSARAGIPDRARADSAATLDSTTAAATEPPAAPDSTRATPFGDLADATSAPASSGATDAADAARQRALARAQAAADSSAAARGFAPEFKASLNSDNDKMRMTSNLTTSFSDPSGIVLNSTLNYGEDVSFTQDTNATNKGISNTFTLPLPDMGLSFMLSTTNAKTNRLTRTVTGTNARNATENRTARLSATYGRDVLQGVRATTSFARNFDQNSQDIVATVGTDNGNRDHEGTGNAWGVGISVDRLAWLKLRGRFGRSTQDNMDRSPSFISAANPAGETPSTSEGDTATVDVDLPDVGWLTNLKASFRMSRGTESFTDVARTGGGGAASVSQFALETRRSFSRALRFNGKVTPFSQLNVDVSVEVARDSTSYAIRRNQFRDAKRTTYNLRSQLKYMKDGTLNVAFRSSTSDENNDEPRNPLNPQTRVDEERQLTADVTQKLSDTFETRLYGEVRLNQSFYAHEGPQGLSDRDELRTQLGLDLKGRINAKMDASVQMYVRTYDQAFIDPRRSSSSRDETEYVVGQTFNYKITPRVSLSQQYRLSSKVLDEIYDPSRNTLNRNHFLRSNMNYQMTDRLKMTMNFDYLLQDNGLFLADRRDPGGERFFTPAARTKKDEIGLGIEYALIRGGKLSFTSRQQSTRERRTSFVGGRATGVSVTERGNLALGLRSHWELGTLKLDTTVQRNESFNVSLNRNVFYNVTSTLSYTF